MIEKRALGKSGCLSLSSGRACAGLSGTGRGPSVLELVNAFEKATGQRVPYVIAPRRDGDIAECWADPSLAAQQLNWRAELTIEQACADGWRWQSNNPNGYRG